MNKFKSKRYFPISIPSLLAAAVLCSCAGKPESLPAPPPAEPPPAAPVCTEAPAAGKIIISELMYRNDSTLSSPSGAFPDWVELCNVSDEKIELEGFTLSDREDESRWSFPPCALESGEYMLLFCSKESTDPTEPGFSLSEGETLYLRDADGNSVASVSCSAAGEGCSLSLKSDGIFISDKWPSPGFENTKAGYDSFAASQTAPGPLIINEAVTAGSADIHVGEDWAEIKNISAGAISLSGYFLTDDMEEPEKWRFPDMTLEPGGLVTVLCTGGPDNEYDYRIHAGFSLSSLDESLYITAPGGELIDYVHLHHIPPGCSMGRMENENGFFYFTDPRPGDENTGGKRRVSDTPSLVGEEGVFNDVSSVSAGLSGEGTIFYTTDGTAPGPESPEYSGELSFDKTTVLRAVSVEEGALPGRPAAYSFIINEQHTLPVLSLVAEEPLLFLTMFQNGYTNMELQANLALFDGDNSFSHPCTVCMKGYTSLSLPKKSMGVSFKGYHGGELENDIFGSGADSFSKLSIRAGQDYTFAIMRNELFQELCLEGSDSLYTQRSKYCILYVNGSYYGIYCLKEDLNRAFYASHTGVSRDSVECIKFPAPMGSSFWNEVLEFCWNNDMSLDENYQHICSLMDIDSFIDWCIFEGYSANSDIQGNLKIFRSAEGSGKWQFSFYDLDWAFYYSEGDFSYLLEDSGNTGYLMPSLLNTLLNNPDFRQQFLLRFKELNEGVLSNENVLAHIDALQALLEPEAARERERWDLSYESWLYRVDELRSYINDYNREIHNIDQLCRILGIGEAERQELFGR